MGVKRQTATHSYQVFWSDTIAQIHQLEGERLTQALEITAQIQDDYSRASALGSLAPQLEGERLTQALEITAQIQSDSSRASALGSLAPQLEGERRLQALTQALEITAQIQDDDDRARTLDSLLQNVAIKDINKAETCISLIFQILGGLSRSHTLGSIPHLVNILAKSNPEHVIADDLCYLLIKVGCWWP